MSFAGPGAVCLPSPRTPELALKATTHPSAIAASGVISSNDYVAFLKKILSGTLKMHDALSADSWCTNAATYGGLLGFLDRYRNMLPADVKLYAGGEDNFCHRVSPSGSGQFADFGTPETVRLFADEVIPAVPALVQT